MKKQSLLVCDRFFLIPATEVLTAHLPCYSK